MLKRLRLTTWMPYRETVICSHERIVVGAGAREDVETVYTMHTQITIKSQLYIVAG